MTYVRILMPAGDWVAGGFNDLIRGTDAYPAVERDPPAVGHGRGRRTSATRPSSTTTSTRST